MAWLAMADLQRQSAGTNRANGALIGLLMQEHPD